MGNSGSSVFLYDAEKWEIKDILDFLQGLGIKADKSREMAYYDLDEISSDWPLRGYKVEGYDISFEPRTEHPQFGPVGRVDCKYAEFAIFSAEENKKLYNKLKRKFSMTRAERDFKNKKL